MCGRTFDGRNCRKRGEHFCIPRADHAQAFAEEICVHTKDRWARRPFILAEWQREDIVRPLFGEVRWDDEALCYVRRFRIAWIELARKNGKSELLAFVALYLLVGDGVESAEVYGCARDTDQARLVFNVAARMVRLSPVLSKRLRVIEHSARIVDEKTNSVYVVVPADALGNLGSNPSCVIFDEVLTQPNGDFWNAMRTGMGTRLEPLLIAATTAGNDPASFAKGEHDEFVKIGEDPSRAPHRFVYLRNTPADADPWDEANWYHANPALGDFLSLAALREEALEARNDPLKENAFRQFRLNQWVNQASRWMPMHLYAACTGSTRDEPAQLRRELARRPAWGGLDLASKLDLTAWCLVVPDGIDGHPAPCDGSGYPKPGSRPWTSAPTARSVSGSQRGGSQSPTVRSSTTTRWKPTSSPTPACCETRTSPTTSGRANRSASAWRRSRACRCSRSPRPTRA